MWSTLNFRGRGKTKYTARDIYKRTLYIEIERDRSIGATFMYLQYSHPLIYHLLPNVWKASYTISASIFVNVPYWPPYTRDKFISCVVPGPSQWFFHFGEEIVITWTISGEYGGCFRISHFQRHKRSVTAAHSPTLTLLYLRHSSFSNPSFPSPTSQGLHLIHLASRPCPGPVNFLVEVFSVVFPQRKTNVRQFSPHASPGIIWPSSSKAIFILSDLIDIHVTH